MCANQLFPALIPAINFFLEISKIGFRTFCSHDRIHRLGLGLFTKNLTGKKPWPNVSLRPAPLTRFSHPPSWPARLNQVSLDALQRCARKSLRIMSSKSIATSGIHLCFCFFTLMSRCPGHNHLHFPGRPLITPHVAMD